MTSVGLYAPFVAVKTNTAQRWRWSGSDGSDGSDAPPESGSSQFRWVERFYNIFLFSNSCRRQEKERRDQMK